MSADSVCRVCLVDNMNIYCVRNELQNVYERLSGEKCTKIGYPVHMCYICLTVLQKCHRFMETARNTNNMLRQWYNQQNEMRVARPLYTYSTSKVKLVSTYDENMTLQNDIKVEKMASEQEVQPEYAECYTDVVIEKTDVDEQTDCSDFLEDSPNDRTYTDTVEDNNDGQNDPLFVNHEDFKEISNLALNFNDHKNVKTRIEIISPHDNDAPLRTRETNETKSRHRAPETSGETAANRETSNDITPLNSTSYQPDKIRRRNNKTEPTFAKNNRSSKETANITKIVKTNVIQKKNESVINTKINSFNKMPHNTSIIEKNKINPCNYKTTVKQNITSRLERNTDEKQFVCDVEDYKSKQKVNSESHVGTHSGEKPYSCDICDHTFSRKYHLKTHKRIHTGEKQFTCNVCDYKSDHKGSLHRHMRTHTNEKPFSCNVCDYKSIHKANLERHMRTHTGEKPFSCEICNYKCARNSSLVIHMRSHTGEKPFACDICDYKCTHKSSLVRHMRTHTDEKPFPCDIYDC